MLRTAHVWAHGGQAAPAGATTKRSKRLGLETLVVRHRRTKREETYLQVTTKRRNVMENSDKEWCEVTRMMSLVRWTFGVEKLVRLVLCFGGRNIIYPFSS